MQQAIDLADKLNEKIRDSEEYKYYIETARRLKEESELYQRYNEFRKKNYELQYSEGDSNLYDEVFNLSREYDTILQDSRVNDFILAEQRFCAMMREVYRILSKELEMDYEYLEK